MKIRYTYNSYGTVKFFTKIIVLTLAILIAGYLVPGVHINGVFSAVLASVVLALLNIFLRPILIVLTLPFTVFSMGIFLLFINAFIVYIVSLVVPNVEIDGFWMALLFSIVITILSSLLEIPEKLINRKFSDEEKKQGNNLEDFFGRSEEKFDEYDDITDDESVGK